MTGTYYTCMERSPVILRGARRHVILRVVAGSMAAGSCDYAQDDGCDCAQDDGCDCAQDDGCDCARDDGFVGG